MTYIPNRGDIVWLNFSLQAGHEQVGTRPALILSPEKYNKKTGLAVCCPITSNVKGYPFEVAVKGKKITGAVLSDHLKNLDWKVRKAKFIEKAPNVALEECLMKISALFIQA
ncbi:MAG: endoribonuclease MazF [Deltaproteobacteria bacterium]|jgi:mRNA interferase MazF|nr:endoribonuclease MazF [Deltaproteobacteria bacterium]